MLGWLRRIFGGTPKQSAKRIRGVWDSAQTTDENKNHWANADDFGPVWSTYVSDRKVLRERSRYEVSNNSYARGIVNTLAQNLVGPSGPTLQSNHENAELADEIERFWAQYAHTVRFAETLRTAKVAKTVDGEAFGLLVEAPYLKFPVQVNLKLIEADQVTTPWAAFKPWVAIDGIEFDQYGEPLYYTILRVHPGDWYLSPRALDKWHRDSVCHWFRKDRPGQPRGIPELTPALPLFSQMRRFGLATLTAAETAANFAAVLKTNAPPSTDTAQPDPFETVDIERGMMTALPNLYELQQFKAEHPTTNHEMFIKILLREACRCIGMPWNIAAGDSSSFNYSSARLDHLNYWSALQVEREDCERELCDPWFSKVIHRAVTGGFLPQEALAATHKWAWPAREYIDPLVEEQAATEGLSNGTRSLQSITGPRGDDWRRLIREQEEAAIYRQQVREQLTGEGNGSIDQQSNNPASGGRASGKAQKIFPGRLHGRTA